MNNNELIDWLGRFEILTDKPLFKNVQRVLEKYPNTKLDDALSRGQLKSKRWLVDELFKITPTPQMTFVLGGWYGILGMMLLERYGEAITVRSFDKDLSCASIADLMNKEPWVKEDWHFKASTEDMYKLDYTNTKHVTFRADGSCVEMVEQPDTIINTSCEHLEDFDKWWNLIPEDKLVVLQSNDYFEIPDHCNCVKSLEDFEKSINMSTILYSGTLPLGNYNRFMLIGMK